MIRRNAEADVRVGQPGAPHDHSAIRPNTVPKGNATLARLSPVPRADRRGVSMSRKPHNVPPRRKNRPTKVALREMAKIRKVLGLPRLPEPI